MAEQQNTFDPTLTEGRGTMLQSALLLFFCLLVGVLSLAVCAWVVIFGQLFTLDGLLTVSISLLVGALFMANLAWSVYTGELREILNQLRKRPASGDASGEGSGEGQK